MAMRDGARRFRSTTGCAARTGYRAAAEAIRDRLRDYGLEEVEIISLPADGTHLLRHPALAARLERALRRACGRGGERIASWAEQPISLAQDSVSGRAEAELVDIGAGTSESDYQGKEVRGRLVLTSSQPEAVAGARHRPLRRGGHRLLGAEPAHRLVGRGREPGPLGPSRAPSPEHPTFAFMVSPARARAWQERLRRGEAVRLRAEVDAGREPERLSDPDRDHPGPRGATRRSSISCHLDHPNRRAPTTMPSGCAGDPRGGAHPEPADPRAARCRGRSGRSASSGRAEIEATIALLNARPEFARRTLATIHLDMIGGDTEITKSILRVARLAAQPAELRLRRRLHLRALGQRPVAALCRHRRGAPCR